MRPKGVIDGELMTAEHDMKMLDYMTLGQQ